MNVFDYTCILRLGTDDGMTIFLVLYLDQIRISKATMSLFVVNTSYSDPCPVPPMQLYVMHMLYYLETVST